MPSPSKWDTKMLMKEAASLYGEAQVQRGCDVPGLYYKLIINQLQGEFGKSPDIGLSHGVKCPSPPLIVLIRIMLPFVAE